VNADLAAALRHAGYESPMGKVPIGQRVVFSLASGWDMRFEDGGGLCKAQVFDVLLELLEALIAPGQACPGVDVVQLSEDCEVLLPQKPGHLD
jgi:hypothetical protein